MCGAFNIFLLLAIGAVASESPSAYKGWYARLDNAPYQPSGWRPSGPDFKLPVPQAPYRSIPQGYLPVPPQEYGPPPQQPPQGYLSVPSQEYGPPPQEYGPPPQEYGPPGVATTTTSGVELTTTTKEPTTTEAATTTEGTTEAESTNSVDGEEQSQKLIQPGERQGVYFIYHPSGLLQRVAYSTKDDTAQMAFSANFKYENVEPISGPIYTYDPQTFAFQRLN